MKLRPAALLSSLALLAGGLTILTTPDIADAAGNTDTVFIDDALLAAGILLTAFACAVGVRARRTRTGRS